MKIQKIEISKLTADPANANTHPERSIEAIMGSLRRFGQQKPIVVDKDLVVRAGNGTVEAAKRLGWTHILAHVSDLSGSEMTAYAIADNRTAQLAEWDLAALDQQLKALHEEGVELEDVGFTEEELSSLFPTESVDEEQVESVDQSGKLKDLYKVVIDCKDEAQQLRVLELLNANGIEGKAIIV